MIWVFIIVIFFIFLKLIETFSSVTSEFFYIFVLKNEKNNLDFLELYEYTYHIVGCNLLVQMIRFDYFFFLKI